MALSLSPGTGKKVNDAMCKWLSEIKGGFLDLLHSLFHKREMLWRRGRADQPWLSILQQVGKELAIAVSVHHDIKKMLAVTEGKVKVIKSSPELFPAGSHVKWSMHQSN